MRVLVVSERYAPEITPASFRIAEHAAHWLARGHEVTVLTSVPNHPRGVPFPGYRNLPYQVEWRDGVRVVRVWSFMARARGSVRRSLDYLSFTAAALAASSLLPDFDVLLATSPTLAAAAAGCAIARLRRRPWVFEVRDPWPSVIRSLEAVRSELLLRQLERLERALYHDAAHVVCVYPSIQERVLECGVPRGKTSVIVNGVDRSVFDPAAHPAADLRGELGLPADAFVVGYAGTVGLAQGLETLARAAAALREDPQVWFVVLGEGSRRPELEAEVARLGLPRFRVRDFVPRERIPAWLRAFDVGVVHLVPGPAFRGTIPSKLFELMALGVPILLGIEGQATELVRAAGCGEVVPPGDAAAMAAAIARLKADPAARRRASEAGPRAAASYDRDELAGRLLAVLERVAARRG